MDKLFKANPDGIHSIPQHVLVDNDEYITSFQISDASAGRSQPYELQCNKGLHTGNKHTDTDYNIGVCSNNAGVRVFAQQQALNERPEACDHNEKGSGKQLYGFERINDEFEKSPTTINMMNELVKNRLYAKDMEIRVLQQQINHLHTIPDVKAIL